jgi:hypothetical protein
MGFGAIFKTKNQNQSKSKSTSPPTNATMATSLFRRPLFYRSTTQRLFHNAAPLFSNDKKDEPPDDSPPVQTFNKSPIVQKLWKTRGQFQFNFSYLV